MTLFSKFWLCSLFLVGTSPSSTEDHIRILWAPDEAVVGRIFRIVLAGHPDMDKLEVDYSPALELFDRANRFPGTNQGRFYFRALAPAEKTTVQFTLNGKVVCATAVKIWSRIDNMTILGLIDHLYHH